MSKAQNDTLLAALATKSMTATEIWQELGIARASARVFDLREAGHDVISTEITVRNRHGDPCRVAMYSLGTSQRALIPAHPGRGYMSSAAVRA